MGAEGGAEGVVPLFSTTLQGRLGWGCCLCLLPWYQHRALNERGSDPYVTHSAPLPRPDRCPRPGRCPRLAPCLRPSTCLRPSPFAVSMWHHM